MRSKLVHLAVSLIVFVGLSLVLVCLTSAGRLRTSAAQAEEGGQEHAEAEPAHDHGHTQSDAEDDHGEHVLREPPTLEALRALECEHGCPTLDCDECRYELGVAKLNPLVAEGLVQKHQVQTEQRVRNALELTGEIQLDLTRVVEITSAGSGRIESIHRLIGDAVQVSDTLAVVQSAEFGQAQADFLQIQARCNLARQTYEREKTLSERNVSSQADFLAARNEYVAAEAAQTAARKRLQLFGVSDEQVDTFVETDAGQRFGQLVLTAPIAGTILEQNVVRGQWVAPAQRLYRIADLSRLWVWCNLYESDLAALHERMTSGGKVEAQIQVTAFPSETFKATVDRIGNQLDRDTRTVRVRLIADNAEGKLKPGMFVNAFIPLAECERVVHVPESALLTDEGSHFVFTQLTDELWIRRDVAVGHRDRGVVEVLAGLTEGEIIAARGAFMFKSEVLKEKMGAGCAH